MAMAEQKLTDQPIVAAIDVGRVIGGRCNKCKHRYHIGRCPVWRLDKPKRCACVHDNQGET